MFRLALLLFTGACGSAPIAERVEQRAVYGTSRGVFDLSLARSDEGAMLSWTEGVAGTGGVSWLPLEPEGVAAHTAALEPPPIQDDRVRVWSPLARVEGGFARLTWDGVTLSLLSIADDGRLRLFADLPIPFSALEDAAPLRVELVGTPSGAVVAGIDPSTGETSLQQVDGSGEELGAAFGTGIRSCIALPFRVAFDSVRSAVIVVQTECPSVTTSDLDEQEGPVDVFPSVTTALFGSRGFAGGGTARAERPLFTFDLSEEDAPRDAAIVVGLETVEDGFGSLWLTLDGRIRLFLHRDAEQADFDEPAVDLDDQKIAAPRLLATRRHLILTWRPLGEDGEPGPTRALVADPGSGRVSSPFDWPVGDECPIGASLPRDDGLEYACVGPCHGDGCTESWIERGRVVIDY